MNQISLLLMGMFLWLYGLWIFSRMLRHHTTDISITYFCLALCSVGCAVCKVCLSKMESPMGAVAKFTSGQEISRLSAECGACRAKWLRCWGRCLRLWR